MRAAWIMSVVLGFPRVLAAQSHDVPVESTREFPANVRAQVTGEFVELRAGPGAAYISRGRAYQGDQVIVKKRGQNGEWLEVVAGGIRGWVRAADMRLVREGVRRDADGKTEAGRDRRETNFRYDKNGRRIFADGRAMGSGEGTTEGVLNDTGSLIGPDLRPKSARKLAVRFGVGASQIKRSFASNIGADGKGGSALANLVAAEIALSSEIAIDWEPLPYLTIHAQFRDSRLAATQIAKAPPYGFGQGFELAMEAQQVDLDVIGRYALKTGWLGGYTGLRVLRQGFQQTAPYALFLKTNFIGVGAGLATGWTFGQVDIAARGGIALPVSIKQAPLISGTADGFGFDGGVEISLNLAPAWAIVATGHFQQFKVDFTGPSQHADTITDPAGPRRYTAARETDSITGGGISIRWRP